MPPYERPTNMMFQSYALFPHMSVADNIAFGLKQDSMPKAEIADRVAEMLKLVKLEQFAKRKPAPALRRPAAARGACPRRRQAAEGAAARRAARRARQEAARGDPVRADGHPGELGVTFVIVTHDQEEAMTMADRIAVMDQGRLVQVGPPGRDL